MHDAGGVLWTLLKLSPTFGGVIERGIRAPSFETLELIGSNLGMTVSELFDSPWNREQENG